MYPTNWENIFFFYYFYKLERRYMVGFILWLKQNCPRCSSRTWRNYCADVMSKTPKICVVGWRSWAGCLVSSSSVAAVSNRLQVSQINYQKYSHRKRHLALCASALPWKAVFHLSGLGSGYLCLSKAMWLSNAVRRHREPAQTHITLMMLKLSTWPRGLGPDNNNTALVPTAGLQMTTLTSTVQWI